MKVHFGWKPLILWSLHLYDTTSYFLGKVAHQVNGFVLGFLILFFNSTLKWMNAGINFYNIARVLALYKSYWAAMNKIFIYARPCVNNMT